MANKGLIMGVVTLIIILGLLVLGKQIMAPSKHVQNNVTETVPMFEAPVAATEEAVAPETTEGAMPVAEPETAAVEPAKEELNLLDAPAGLTIDVKKAMQERTLGDPQAKVTIVEYASMTCPHCAQFHRDIFPEVKARLIDTGKVMFIFREYPLDGTALKVSKIVRCADHDKFFDLIEVMFRNQERWIKAEDPVKAASQFAALAGMDDIYIKLCAENVELENELLAKINDGQSRYSITQTPTFVFNGGEEKISGEHPVEKFEEIVNKLSAGK